MSPAVSQRNLKTDQPLVSVGIPTFNRPEGLERSLKCISEQTYHNIEIIVSDNASPGEGTRRIVGEYIEKDNRIKYYRQQSNLGPVANFQFVLDAANGEYFMWMADDDWRAPTFIEALLHTLQSDVGAVLAFCDLSVCDEQGYKRNDFFPSYMPYLSRLTTDNRLVRLTRFFLQHEELGKANLIYGLMRRNAIADVSLGALLARFGFYGLDNLVIFTLLKKGNIKLVDEVLYGCTVGNVKHYAVREAPSLSGRLQTIANQLNYLSAYLGLTNGALRLVFAVTFPIKVISFYWGVVKRRIASRVLAKRLNDPNGNGK